MKIETKTILPPDESAEAWKFYERVFTPVNALAAQRHLMTGAEFDAVAADERVLKYPARDDDGTLLGLGVQTNDLEAWPLISPAFFARRWPRHFEQRRIWYVGFVGVGGYHATTLHVFTELVTAMHARILAGDGIAVMDFCAFNVDLRKVPYAAWRIQDRQWPGTTGGVIDRQEFWAFRYDGEPV